MFQVGIDSFENTKLAKWQKESERSQGLRPRAVNGHTASSSTPVRGECHDEDVADDPEDVDEDTEENQEELEEDIGRMRSSGSMRLVDGELVVEYDSDSDIRRMDTDGDDMDIDDGGSGMDSSSDSDSDIDT